MSPLHPSGGAAAACSVTATVRQANPAESKTTGGNTGNTANSVMSPCDAMPLEDDLAGTSGVAEIAENKFYVAWSAPAMHVMPAPGRWVHAAARLRGREG